MEAPINPVQNGGTREIYLILDEDPKLLRREDILPHVNQLVSALAEDNVAEFLRVAKDREELVNEGRTNYVIHPSLLLRWAIYLRALECAKELLKGNVGSMATASEYTRDCEMDPLHQAAGELLPDFVELFLRRGVRCLPCMYIGSEFFYMLPLNIAVQKLSEKIQWTPTQSIYRLIFTLCGTMELEQGFRTLSQLMRAASVEEEKYRHTCPSMRLCSVEQNRDSIHHYARQGKIVELAIFLYVDAISEFGIFKNFSNDEYLSLCQSLDTNPSSHPKAEIQYVVDGNGVIKSMGENHAMKTLLQIFYQTKFSMLGFNATREILAQRIKDAGFDWISGDLQNLGNNVATTKVVKHQKICGVRPGGSFNILPIRAQLGRPWSNSAWYFHEKRGISSAAQTFPRSQLFGSRSMPMLFTERDIRARAGNAISHEGTLGLSCSLRKMWHIFSVAIRRKMMYA